MTEDELLGLDYERTLGVFGQLSEIRFKLLASSLGYSFEKANSDAKGGLFSSRPGRGRNLFGQIEMRYDWGLARVYAPALAAWSFGGISTFWNSRLALTTSALVAIPFFLELLRLDRRKPRPAKRDSHVATHTRN